LHSTKQLLVGTIFQMTVTNGESKRRDDLYSVAFAKGSNRSLRRQALNDRDFGCSIWTHSPAANWG
jgi:hypothetical protein